MRQFYPPSTFSKGLISGSGDKILADCGRARLWSATRVLAVCIRVETFDFRGETTPFSGRIQKNPNEFQIVQVEFRNVQMNFR